jgi:hypothetical protein
VVPLLVDVTGLAQPESGWTAVRFLLEAAQVLAGDAACSSCARPAGDPRRDCVVVAVGGAAGPVAGAAGARRGRGRCLAGRDFGEGTRLAAETEAWICFDDEAGQYLRPPKART